MTEKLLYADTGHVVVIAPLDAPDQLPVAARRLDLGLALGAVLDVDLVRGGVQVPGVKVDTDDAAFPGHCPDHVFRHVTWKGGNRLPWGMRGEDGRATGLDRIPHG